MRARSSGFLASLRFVPALLITSSCSLVHTGDRESHSLDSSVPIDAGFASFDAGSRMNARFDAAHDGGSDASFDTRWDAFAEAGSDAELDAGSDAAIECELDRDTFRWQMAYHDRVLSSRFDPTLVWTR